MIVYRDGTVIIRDSIYSDIESIAKDVREIDQADIQQLFSMTPVQSMKAAYDVSTYRFTVICDHRPVAMLGLVPDTLLSRRALVWMVTTNAIENMKFKFLKGSRGFLRFLLDIYPNLYGNVRTENGRSFNWLSWLGADLFPSIVPISHNFTLGEK